MEFALSAVVSVEAIADTGGVVTKTTTGAITTRLITKTLHNISTGWALNKRTIRSTTAQITKTPNVLLGIPRGGVCSRGFRGELLLGETDTRFTALVRADSTLTGDTLVIIETCAFT